MVAWEEMGGYCWGMIGTLPLKRFRRRYLTILHQFLLLMTSRTYLDTLFALAVRGLGIIESITVCAATVGS
jgi:hypothetical protein